MSVADLTEIISPAFTEKTIFDIIKKKTNLINTKIVELLIDDGASKKGDSYLSSICRFVVKASGTNLEGTTETISLPVIVKFFPKNIARQKTFRSSDFFKTEIYFYERVWPEMKKIKSDKISEEIEEIPLLLASYCDGKNDFIALEDLSYQGFQPTGRNEKFTREQLLVLLQSLANFHALGIVTREKNPQFVNIASKMEESYFADRYLPWYQNFLYNSLVPQYQKAVLALLPPEYHDRITKLFAGNFYGEIIKCCTIRDKLSSVTEGDAWLPNFLARTDKNGKYTSILIDFQLARYAPVTTDLLQFLYSGLPNQMLLEHWDDLIAEYHGYLSKRIEDLGGEKNYITLKEIHDEIKRHPYAGLMMAMESVVMSLLEDDEVCDVDLLKGENAVPLEDVWILPEFQKSRNERLAFLVKHFVDKEII